METQHNECPCCHQDWVADTDRNCPTCDLPVSEHVSVEVLCRRVREAQNRESALIVERDKERALADQLADSLFATLCGWINEPSAEKASQSLAAWKESRQDGNHRIITWPHDADPFTSPDHDNDSNIYS